MKKFLKKVSLFIGGVVAILGISTTGVDANISKQKTESIHQVTENSPLYLEHASVFNSQLGNNVYAWHYSHYSHSSHYSHYSHYSHHSHYSHYSGY